MVVLDGTVKSKALVCLVLYNLLLILAQEDFLGIDSIRFNRDIVLEEDQILETNRQVTVFLPAKKVKVFEYLDIESKKHNLSITVIPCLDPIKWSLIYRSNEENDFQTQNLSNYLENGVRGDTYEIETIKTVKIERANKGWYFIVFHSLSSDTSVSIFITLDDGGPFELTIPQKSNIVLTPQRRQRLKVTWDQSLINPQNTSYCLVVNTKKEYSSLCGAAIEGPMIRTLEVPPTVNLNNVNLGNLKKMKYAKIEKALKPNNDTVIVCVDKKKQLIFKKMKRGVKYYFNLFAINNKTNLTVPYGKSSLWYSFSVRPITLKDGVRKLVDFKKVEGKQTFRFKVNNSTRELHFYVLSCGGVVDVEIKPKGLINRRGKKAKESARSLPKPTQVFGYKRFKILYPAAGEQYYIKVNAPNVDELSRMKYVEVFGTLYPAQRYPLPLLPEEPNLYEFKSQKRCNSVTIGWVPAYDTSWNTYCVVVWENQKFNYADLFRGYYQCNLDNRSKKFFFASPNEYLVSKECEDMITKNRKSITNYRIRELKPNTSYTIQVTVKKKYGRTLSYKFLKVYTKHSCEHL